MVKTTNDLAEHVENECLYQLETCRLCNERVQLNAMKVKFSLFLVTGTCLLLLVKKTFSSTLPRLLTTFRQWLCAFLLPFESDLYCFLLQTCNELNIIR